MEPVGHYALAWGMHCVNFIRKALIESGVRNSLIEVHNSKRKAHCTLERTEQVAQKSDVLKVSFKRSRDLCQIFVQHSKNRI